MTRLIAPQEWGSGHVPEEVPVVDMPEQHEIEKELKYTLLIKYIVRPSLAKEFSEQQLKASCSCAHEQSPYMQVDI